MSVHIRVRKTKAGEPRYQVRYRLGGRDSRQINGGTYTTLEQAEHVRDEIGLGLAGGTIRWNKAPTWIPKRRQAPTTVYIAKGRQGQVLYVGITGTGLRRLHSHADSSAWWPLARSFELEHFKTRGEAEERERELIRSLDPPYNTTFRVRATVGGAA